MAPEARHQSQLTAAAQVGLSLLPCPLPFLGSTPSPTQESCASTQGLPEAPGETRLTGSDQRSSWRMAGASHGRPTVHPESSGAGTGREQTLPLSPRGRPSRREEQREMVGRSGLLRAESCRACRRLTSDRTRAPPALGWRDRARTPSPSPAQPGEEQKCLGWV